MLLDSSRLTSAITVQRTAWDPPMANRETLDERRAEFNEHVWNHSEDAFQMSFDEHSPLADSEVELVLDFLAHLRDGADDATVAGHLRRKLEQTPEAVFLLMQVVGLTRNKIIQDLKASLADSPVTVPGKADGLFRNDSVWELAGPYLARRLRTVLSPIANIPEGSRGAVEALNQATWPGWIRQERAKRSGHEAEFRLAKLFEALDLPFEPMEKATNPLCRDAQVDGISYDLVVPDDRSPSVCFKATVHTSNIGQYGESKDALEAKEALETLKKRNPRPLLLALIDGVGFWSNRQGLDGVLEVVDEFCQFATLWKAAVVVAASTGIQLQIDLPDPASHSSFLERYGGTMKLAKFEPTDITPVGAGEARLKTVR